MMKLNDPVQDRANTIIQRVESDIAYVLNLCEEYSPVDVDVEVKARTEIVQIQRSTAPSSWQMGITYVLKPRRLNQAKKINYTERIADLALDPDFDHDDENILLLKNTDKNCIAESRSQLGNRLESLLLSKHTGKIRLKLPKGDYQEVTHDLLKKSFVQIAEESYRLRG